MHALHVMRARADVVANKLGIILLVRMKCVRTHVLHARADIVATILGIILLFGGNEVRAHARCTCEGGHSGHYTWHYSFFFFHAHTFLPEGVYLGS